MSDQSDQGLFFILKSAQYGELLENNTTIILKNGEVSFELSKRCCLPQIKILKLNVSLGCVQPKDAYTESATNANQKQRLVNCSKR